MNYLNANENAIKNIKSIIDSENIDCDFEFQSNYIFTNNSNNVQQIKDEVSAVNSIGFNANFVTNIDLNIPILAGIKYPNQAQFHPKKYALSLCNIITDSGNKIFENSKIYDIKKTSSGFCSYTKNNKINSKYVILASHYPIINFPRILFSKNVSEYILCYLCRYSL